MKKQSLVRGAFVLTLAAFITRILVFANTIIQARLLGSEGIGLKMMVKPFMGLMITMTTIGLPIAISKLVAEADAKKNTTKIKKILLISIVIALSLSIIVVALALMASQLFASHFFTDKRSYYSFLALIPIVPVVAVSSVIKGYFRGMQNMNPLAFSQVLEQFVRIIFTYFLVQLLLPYGIEYAAAGTILSNVIGEVVSLLYLLTMFNVYHHRRAHVPKTILKHVSKGKAIVNELLQIGLPTTGNGFVLSATRALQPVIITKSLAIAGLSSVLITKQYGMLTGFVMPLLFFPGFINQSLGVTLVPAISEANARNNQSLIRRRINQASCVALMVGIPSTIFLCLFAQELMTIIYNSSEAAPLLKVIAPFFVFRYLQTPLHSALIGLGKAKTAMFNNMISKGATLLLIYPLASNAKLQIYGVILAIGIGVILETGLYFKSIFKMIGFPIKLGDVTKLLISGLIMGYSGKILFNLLSRDNLVMLIISLLVALWIYVSLLTNLRVIRKNDIARVPVLGNYLVFLIPGGR